MQKYSISSCHVWNGFCGQVLCFSVWMGAVGMSSVWGAVGMSSVWGAVGMPSGCSIPALLS